MPRGNPGKSVTFRIDPALLAAVKDRTPNVTRAVEDGLRLWLARDKRKIAQGDKLARRLAPPTERELKGRAGSHPMPLPPDAPQLGGKKLG